MNEKCDILLSIWMSDFRKNWNFEIKKKKKKNRSRKKKFFFFFFSLWYKDTFLRWFWNLSHCVHPYMTLRLEWFGAAYDRGTISSGLRIRGIKKKTKSFLPPCNAPNDYRKPFKIKILDQRKSRFFFSKLDFWIFGVQFFPEFDDNS